MEKIDDLISELRQLSPLPEDAELTKDVLDRYDAIVSKIAAQKDDKSIEPLIDSFGYGEGFGVYWRVLHVLEEFEIEKVDPILIKKLIAGDRGAKMWAAYMLGRSKNKNAVDNLFLLLKDENDLVRHNAAMALGMIGDTRAKHSLENLKADKSHAVRNAAERSLRNLEKNDT